MAVKLINNDDSNTFLVKGDAMFKVLKALVFWLVVVPVVVLFLLGFTTSLFSPAVQRAMDTARQANNAAHQEESQRQAIVRALDYDKSITQQVQGSVSFSDALEYLLGGDSLNSEYTINYVRNLKRVPLDGCPSDFQAAYRQHILAWELRDKTKIKATWMDILASVRLHGVEYPGR